MVSAELRAGRLLVATPLLLDPNFRRTVVLICARDEQGGTMGLVLNRPIEAGLDVVLPEWRALVAPPAVLFAGGPVQREVALALGRASDGPPAAGWTGVTESLGLVNLAEDPAVLAPRVDALRVYSGYAGWAPGQLEGEIGEQAWFVVDATPADAFSDQPHDLWRAVLRRQRGTLAMFADFPTDPRAN
jgi:putative transcriptional regulator